MVYYLTEFAIKLINKFEPKYFIEKGFLLPKFGIKL